MKEVLAEIDSVLSESISRKNSIGYSAGAKDGDMTHSNPNSGDESGASSSAFDSITREESYSSLLETNNLSVVAPLKKTKSAKRAKMSFVADKRRAKQELKLAKNKQNENEEKVARERKGSCHASLQPRSHSKSGRGYGRPKDKTAPPQSPR